MTADGAGGEMRGVDDGGARAARWIGHRPAALCVASGTACTVVSVCRTTGVGGGRLLPRFDLPSVVWFIQTMPISHSYFHSFTLTWYAGGGAPFPNGLCETMTPRVPKNTDRSDATVCRP